MLPEDRSKEYLKTLVGKAAKAKSKMLPSGVVVVDGGHVEAVSEGMPIEVGQEVRIVQIRGISGSPAHRIGLCPPKPPKTRLRGPSKTIVEDPFFQDALLDSFTSGFRL